MRVRGVRPEVLLPGSVGSSPGLSWPPQQTDEGSPALGIPARLRCPRSHRDRALRVPKTCPPPHSLAMDRPRAKAACRWTFAATLNLRRGGETQ
ncbi:hypothetical protein NDU88_007036 [Pleurodeles waltl]|uniref:Uncharacterized protein n=1 Tax=Pleurodeles waltl TaxID=8319 RepID=A0AAV7URA2_PLEWA|nr:hypothetical protein NDU88_007036 [Pleurodeles waltl]